MKNIILKLYGSYLNMLAAIAPRTAARRGFLLFCKPFRTPITQKQRQFLDGAHKFEIQHEGENVQGYRWGNGDKRILFLHGWQSHSYRWKPYVEALDKANFTIYALDAPGHGLSTGDFLSVPVYSNLIQNFVTASGPFDSVIGHSLGGFSMLYSMYESPKLEVDKLILLAPPGEANDFIDVFRNTLGLSAKTVGLVTDYFSRKYGVGPEYFSTTRFSGNIQAKGLIIHDEDDAEAPHVYSIRLQKSWGNSHLVSSKGFGHNLRSATIVKEVVQFITAPSSFDKVSGPALSSPLEKL